VSTIAASVDPRSRRPEIRKESCGITASDYIGPVREKARINKKWLAQPVGPPLELLPGAPSPSTAHAGKVDTALAAMCVIEDLATHQAKALLVDYLPAIYSYICRRLAAMEASGAVQCDGGVTGGLVVQPQLLQKGLVRANRLW
jgi:hypothetical protein